jgi:predicted glutamine amidotransferase
LCRIAGIIQTGSNKITPQEVKALLLNMEYGGRDATGMAFILDNEIVYSKAKGKASSVIKEDFVDKIANVVGKAKAILLHTRAATHGSPKDNRNNHPIIGDKYIMVHNGVVETDSKYKATGETDTEQMLRSMETHGLVKGLSKTTGWVATLFADIETCNKLYWYVNPSGSLTVAKDERDLWIFASTKSIISQSVKTKIEEYKIDDYKLYEYTLSNNSLKIIGTPKVKSAYHNYWYGYADWGSWGKSKYSDCAKSYGYFPSSPPVPVETEATEDVPWYKKPEEKKENPTTTALTETTGENK